jgi:peptidyl-prolyl cis-trans isomerase C
LSPPPRSARPRRSPFRGASVPIGSVLVAALCLAAAPAGDGDVVARVNGQGIGRRDFDLAVQLHFARRRPGAVSLPELRAAREQILEKLIDGELLYQAAVKKGLSTRDADVDTEYHAKEKQIGSPEALGKFLKDNHFTEAQFREQIRRSLIVGRFVDTVVVPDLKVTDEEVRRYYDQNPTEMTRAEAAHIAQIMVRVAPDAPTDVRAAARDRIEAILGELRAGGDFAELARKHSDGPEVKRGGDTGWLKRGGGAPPPIEAAAFSLEAGQTSDIISTRRGFHLVKVIERRPGGAVPFENVKDSIRARLLEQDRERGIASFLEPLRTAARIERRLPPAPAAR